MRITNWLAGWLNNNRGRTIGTRRRAFASRLPIQAATIETLESRVLLKATALGSEFVVNTYTAGTEVLWGQSSNAIATDHDGNFVVTWTSTGRPGDAHDGSGMGVYARRFQANGTAIGAEFLVNSTTLGNQQHSTVAMNDAGEFIIVWTSADGQDTSLAGVYAQRYNADGTTNGGEFLVNTNTTGNQSTPSVALANDGSFVIVWIDGSPSSGPEVRGQRYIKNGATRGAEFVVNASTASGNAAFPTVSMSDDGAFVVGWSSSGSAQGIYARVYSTTGVATTGDIRVTTSSNNRPFGLDADSNGNFVLAYESGNTNISARKFTAAGVANGAEFQVNTPTPTGQTRNRTIPRVGLADSGRVFVTWTQSSPQSGGANSYALYMREFKPDRSPEGAEFVVNTIAAGVDGSFGPSAVSVDGEGDIAVVWQTDVTGGSGTTNDIHAQLYLRANPPSDILLSNNLVNENLPVNTPVGTFSTVDLDLGDTFTYQLVPGAMDNAYFALSANDLLTQSVFDYEGQSSYSLLVKVTDSWNFVFTKVIVVNIGDQNDPPSVPNTTFFLPENSPAGTLVGTVPAFDSDVGQNLTYAIASGNANGTFAINVNTGAITVNNPALLDFETVTSFTFVVTATDNGNPKRSTSGTMVVRLTNVNEKPTGLAVTPAVISENQPIGTFIGTFSATDPDALDTFTYSFVAGSGDTDNGQFTIAGDQLLTAAVYNYEGKTSYKIRVRATDANGATFDKPLVITILNANEAPHLDTATFSLPENVGNGSVAGQLVATDVDVGTVFTYTITAGNTGGAFTVNPNGQLVVANSAALDFETNPTFVLTIRVSDNGNPVLSHSANVTVNLTNVFEAPTNIELSPAQVPENEPSGTLIGSLITTDSDANETFSYTLVTGSGDTNNNLVSIVGNQVFTAASYNRETQPTLTVRIRTLDSHGLSYERALTITVTNVNEVPTDLQLSPLSVAENLPLNTTVGSFSTTDPDQNDTFTYSFISGAGSSGNGQFAIVGNQLRTAAVFNYEGQSSYSVLIRATDAGGLYFDKSFTISIIDVNDAPVLLNSQYSIDENSVANTLVGTLGATDADPGTTLTYTLIDGNTLGAFSLDTATGQIRVANVAALNFEARQSFTLTVKVTDNGSPALSTFATVTILVNDLNEAPTSLSLNHQSVLENQPAGTLVGLFSAVDPDAGNTLSYSLVPGVGDTGNDQFTIIGNQLKTTAVFDREAVSTYSIRARVTDQNGLYLDQVLTITVDNVNEIPTGLHLVPSIAPETRPAGIKIGTFTTDDVDVGDTFTYVMVSGAGSDDNNLFLIVGNELLTTSVLDFETITNYTIRVRTTDHDGLSFERAIPVDVLQRNEPPTNLFLSSAVVGENLPANTEVGTFTSTDPDVGDTADYSLVSGTGSNDNALFKIVNGHLLTATTFDYDTRNTYFIRARATDLGGAFFERPLTIHITNVNDAPTDISLFPNTVAENSPAGTVVGNLLTVDPDFPDSFTYSLVTGLGDVDNAKFTINNLQQIVTTTPLDFEAKSEYSIRVKSVDAGGLSVEKIVLVHATNANDAPTGLELTSTAIDENQPQGTLVGTLIPIDPDPNETFTYNLDFGVGGTDNGQFLISGNRLLALTKFNYETQPTRSIRVRVTDGSGLSYERVFEIQVNNVNEAPTANSLTSTTVAEAQPIGTPVGTFQPTDVDAGDTFTFSLIPGAGSADNAKFAINGQQLVTNAVLDFESQDSYRIRVRTTDAGGLTFDRTFVITATDINEAPTSLVLNPKTIAENRPVGTVVGTLIGTDPDAHETLSYALVDGQGATDNALFQIVNNKLQTAAILDYETNSTLSVRVRVTDHAGATLDQVFSLNVEDGPEPPQVHLTTTAQAALKRQTVAVDEAAVLQDSDSTNFAGGNLSVAITAGGISSDVLNVRNGITSEGVAWKVVRGGKAIQIGNQIVATISGGTRGKALQINFQTGVDRSLAQALLRNVTFRGTTDGSRTLTVLATDETNRVSQPATRSVQVS